MSSNIDKPVVSSKRALVFGILALALSDTGILGIVFGTRAISRSTEYLAAYGVYDGKAKTGRVLGTIGLVRGMIYTILYYIFIVIVWLNVFL